MVQHQILLSCMKLYLHRPDDGTEILKDLFKYVTKESENPDLRDRGYLYWRLLSTDPKLAKEVVLSQRPLLTDQSYTLETELLEKLIENIGCLASVYGKQPEDFVKRLKDNANAREEIDEDDEELLNKDKPATEVQEAPKENVTFTNKGETLLDDNTPIVPVQVIEQPQPPRSPTKVKDLLDDDEPVKPSKPEKTGGDLMDMDEEPEKKYSTSVQQSSPNSMFSTQVKQTKE